MYPEIECDAKACKFNESGMCSSQNDLGNHSLSITSNKNIFFSIINLFSNNILSFINKINNNQTIKCVKINNDKLEGRRI